MKLTCPLTDMGRKEKRKRECELVKVKAVRLAKLGTADHGDHLMGHATVSVSSGGVLEVHVRVRFQIFHRV